jgi:hypothetical protein
VQSDQYRTVKREIGEGPYSAARRPVARDLDDRQCILCKGPLADHPAADHASRVVERMLSIGFPTPVSGKFQERTPAA